MDAPKPVQRLSPLLATNPAALRMYDSRLNLIHALRLEAASRKGKAPTVMTVSRSRRRTDMGR